MSKLSVSAAALTAIWFSAASAFAQTKPEEDEEIPATPSAVAPSASTATSPPAAPTASASTRAAEPPKAVTSSADLDTMRAELKALRDRIDALEAPRPPAVRSLTDPFSLTAYVQAQYESHQDSDDQLRQGGALINQDRFLVRRARIRLDGDWQYAAVALEVEGNTTHGPTFGLRKAEASLQYYVDRSNRNAAWAMATLGLFDTPLGYELIESPRYRPFMERSTGSRSMFPGEPDLGLRVRGGLGFFRWSVAAVNGEPLDESTPFPGQDPNQAKDVIFRVGVDAAPRPNVAVTGGVSALRGKGFHPGTDASKATLQWNDANEDGAIQVNELLPVAATAATPSQNFDRWLVGADAQIALKSAYGATKIYGEVQIGSNMDRGLFPSDPVLLGIDTRQFAWYLAAIQDVTKYAQVGLRYDYYDPNSDVLDKRGGRLLPVSQVVTTWSPLVGLVLPHARLYAQYDIVDNTFARDALGVPTKLKANALTLRLQVDL